jgi:hypothetical protein
MSRFLNIFLDLDNYYIVAFLLHGPLFFLTSIVVHFARKKIVKILLISTKKVFMNLVPFFCIIQKDVRSSTCEHELLDVQDALSLAS